MSRALQLDLLPPMGAAAGLRSTAPATLAGLLVLALAAALAAGCAYHHEQQSAQLEALQRSQERLLRQRAPRTPTAVNELAADPALQRRWAQAGTVLASLSVPWAGLFAALEAVPTRGVVLSDVLPDAQARSLRLQGRANSLPQVLAYVERLAKQPLLGQVHLLSFAVSPVETKADGALSLPLVFTLQAVWKAP